MEKRVVILAYSGGLDTSCILKWLTEDKGFDVVAFIADVGQNDDLKKIATKAKTLGAKEAIIVDIQREFINNYIWPWVGSGGLYEERYMLGTALARPCIARRPYECYGHQFPEAYEQDNRHVFFHNHKENWCSSHRQLIHRAQVEVARRFNTRYLAHGATGKGNDQVRFELAYAALQPESRTIAPWRLPEFYNRFQGRSDLIQYAQEKGIDLPVTRESPYSIDANLFHISYESGCLENPATFPPRDMFKMTRELADTPNAAAQITIHFLHGEPVKIAMEDEHEIKDSLEMFQRLNQLAGEHGIGRIDIVENRFVGVKSRGVYESPAATVLHKAHQDLEIFILDREVLNIKQQLSTIFAKQVYNGLWFSPECDYTRRCLAESQKNVTGWVCVELIKGNVIIKARQSSQTTYNQKLSSMDEHGDYDPVDANGFIRINAIRLQAQSGREN